MDELEITEALVELIERATAFSDCTIDWPGGAAITITTPRNGAYIVVVNETNEG